jgi:hypothetical protein
MVANLIIEMVKFRISKVEGTLRENVGELLYYTLTIRRKKLSITNEKNSCFHDGQP